MIKQFLNQKNCTLVSYGAYESGKTHAMLGNFYEYLDLDLNRMDQVDSNSRYVSPL